MTTSDKDQARYKETLLLYGRASWHFRKEALLSLLNPFGAILTNVGVPFYAGKALASILHDDGQFRTYMINLTVVAIAGVLFNRLGFTSIMTLSAKVQGYLHNLAFSKLLERGSSFHANRISGKLVSDALDFVSSYGVLVNSVYNSAISLIAILVAGILIVTINAWQLGLFLLVMVAITISWALLDSRTRYELRNVRLAATKELTGHLSDSIVNAQTVKTFAGEGKELLRNDQLNDTLRDLRVKDWKRAALSGNNRIAVLLLMLILLLMLVNHLAASDPAVLSTGIFAFTYTFTLLLRLFDINVLTRQVEESFLQASPIMQILDEPNEITDRPHAPALKVSHGRLELQDVGFRYVDASGAQAVFSDFNLDIKPGEKVGLVGPSGSGKTTLTRLLLRFEDIQDGSISIDGQDIREITQASLRRAISYVPQEPLLFHRSIRENIAYGADTAVSDKQIIKAARLAHAHTFIEDLPHGYDTVVGERGIKLSGGQRQRIAIARAILKDSPILILDEATSALDSESEAFIQDALWELMQHRTTLVIAHRLSTVQKLDRIVVLEHGTITEQGPHADLLKRRGTYAKLWARQSGGFIED